MLPLVLASPGSDVAAVGVLSATIELNRHWIYCFRPVPRLIFRKSCRPHMCRTWVFPILLEFDKNRHNSL
jgi:hypothetical protein